MFIVQYEKIKIEHNALLNPMPDMTPISFPPESISSSITAFEVMHIEITGPNGPPTPLLLPICMLGKTCGTRACYFDGLIPSKLMPMKSQIMPRC